MPRALVVDDHEPTLTALAELVTGEGFDTFRAGSVEQARAQIDAARFDVVLADLNLPDGSGLGLLEDARNAGSTAVVLITGQASISSAVEALRKGVTDYLTKPVDFERIRAILGEVTRSAGLADQIRTLKERQVDSGRFGLLVGRAKAMQQIYDLIARVAPSSATVLISGESGSGKELVARTLHDLSRRRGNAFTAVNCGAISPTLMESELFGHEKGSFTGADRRHRGLFERAHHGTLFLDEVTEMPLELQVKLLRVLETGSLTRTGGETPLEVDVRIIAATNRKPDQAVAKGSLREDLFYRLKVFHIPVPPLRDRIDDLEMLSEHFLELLAQKEGRRKHFAPDALEALRQYAWPGNVRELRNVVYTAYLLADGDLIERRALPAETTNPGEVVFDSTSVHISVGTSVADAERRLILTTLAHFDGNKGRTAEVLGISLKTLYNRLHQYGYWTDTAHATPQE